MKRCLIIGKPNVGKTLFLINFSEYLGYKNVELKKVAYDGSTSSKVFSIKDAKIALSSGTAFKTHSLQSLQIDIPSIKGKKTFEFFDSSGIIDGIHGNFHFRKAMAQTLSLIAECDILLHIIDISALEQKNSISGMGEVDFQLAKYGQNKGNYLMLANKIDLLERRTLLIQLQKDYPDIYIIPISALTKQGFNEVKSYVSRRL